MANKQIADFTEQTSPNNSDLMLLSSSGVTMNATVQKIRGVIAVDFGSISSLPQTRPTSGTNGLIKSDMVVFSHYMSNPDAQTGNWTVTTTNGTVTVAGTISGTTSLILYLGRF